MHTTHWIGITGLALNMLGSGLLLWFTPGGNPYTADGLRISGAWSELPASDEQRQEVQRKHLRYALIFRGAFALLVAGFLLQLVDLLSG